MIYQNAILLFTKKLSGEASSSELAELNKLLTENPGLHDKLNALEGYWAGNHVPADNNFIHKHYLRLQQEGFHLNHFEPGIHPGRKYNSKKFVAAGAITLVSIFAILIISYWPLANQKTATEQTQPVTNEIVTRPGSRTHIVLPDGTQAWLNAETRLTYAPDFNKHTRSINLEGEAYFIVAKNAAKPFYINTDDIRIKVTGTTFNVRAYPGEGRSETSLIEGRVEVSVNKTPDQVYYLKPDDKLILQSTYLASSSASSSKNILLVNPAKIIREKIDYSVLSDIPVETAWVNNVLAFSDESFRDVADKMQHWYNVKISFSSHDLEQIHFTGTFETETLQQALDAMQLTAPFNYHLNGNNLLISKK